MNKTISALLCTIFAAAVQADPAVAIEHVRGRAATVSFSGLDAATTNSLVFAWGGADAAGETPEAWPNTFFGGLVRPGDATRTVTLPETMTGKLLAFLVSGVWNVPSDYVQNGLVNQWDGIDNAGTGTHDPAAATWKDKAGTLDLLLMKDGAWNAAGNGLTINGIAATGTVATVAYKTIEILVRRGSSAQGNVIFSSGYGKTGTSGSRYLINMGSTLQFASHEHAPVVPLIPGQIVSGAATYADNDVEMVFQEGARPRHVAEYSETWGIQTNAVVIGARSTIENDSYRWKDGELFTIRLYDRILTDAELSANFRLDAVRYLGVPAGSTVLAASAARTCAKGVSVVATGTDLAGKPTTVTLAFEGVTAPCDLVMAWGSANAGENPASWANRRDLGVVEPDDELRVFDLPSGWGGASAAHARFFLKAGVDAPADYVGNGLINWWDGIDNAGTGTHDPAATTWKDKVGNLDFTLTNNAVWHPAGNALRISGLTAYAATNTAAYRTIEAMYRSTRSSGRVLFFSACRCNGDGGNCSRILVEGGWSMLTYFEGFWNTPQKFVGYPYDSGRIRSAAAVYGSNNRVGSIYCEGRDVPSAGYYNNWGFGHLGATLGDRGPGVNAYPWYGYLHSLRLYDRELTAAELLANHRLDLVRFRGVARDTTVAAASADLAYAQGTAGGYGAEASETVAQKDGLRIDMRDGVRVIEWRKQLLPFTYTATCAADFTDGYVRDGLINWWDGIDNAGVGAHDSTTKIWKDKAGSIDFYLRGSGAWNATHNGLTVSGNSATGRVATAAYRTVETAFRIKDSSARILFASGCEAGKNGSDQLTRFVLFDHDKDGAGTMRGYFDGVKATRYTVLQRDPNRLCTLTGVYDANNTVTNVYGDGVRDTSGKTHTNTWGGGSKKPTIGSRNTDYPWYGEVYAIRLYDRELTSAEIANNHALDLYRFSGNGGAPAGQFAARIKLVQVTGDGDDVSTWSTPVAGTERTLVQSADEGEVEWFAKRGVWKATFELLFGSEQYVFHTETAVFDLRTLGADGTKILIR